jgi:dephospho-CoA kinase
MKVIGLTGNIGCGKSTVAAMLAERGVGTIDADDVARVVRETDEHVRHAIVARFGTLSASELGAIVFEDARALADLESIVHPAVRRAVAERLAALDAAGVHVTAIEAIKLLESPLRGRCDAIWVVTCREEESVKRTVHGRGVSEREVRARLAHQSSQADKIAAADVVIDGSAPLEATRRLVMSALDRLMNTEGPGAA